MTLFDGKKYGTANKLVLVVSRLEIAWLFASEHEIPRECVNPITNEYGLRGVTYSDIVVVGPSSYFLDREIDFRCASAGCRVTRIQHYFTPVPAFPDANPSIASAVVQAFGKERHA